MVKKNNIDYNEYIQSSAWQKKRKQFFESRMWNTYPHGKVAKKFVCYCCGSDERLDLHHRTYKRFGNERISTDLIPVCRTCHTEIHKKQKSGTQLWKATKRTKKKIQRKTK
jgi:phage terminase large subunit GpA-like protein